MVLNQMRKNIRGQGPCWKTFVAKFYDTSFWTRAYEIVRIIETLDGVLWIADGD